MDEGVIAVQEIDGDFLSQVADPAGAVANELAATLAEVEWPKFGPGMHLRVEVRVMPGDIPLGDG